MIVRLVFLLQEVDDLISKLHDNYETQYQKIGQLSSSLANIPQLVHGVQTVCDLLCE